MNQLIAIPGSIIAKQELVIDWLKKTGRYRLGEDKIEVEREIAELTEVMDEVYGEVSLDLKDKIVNLKFEIMDLENDVVGLKDKIVDLEYKIKNLRDEKSKFTKVS